MMLLGCNCISQETTPAIIHAYQLITVLLSVPPILGITLLIKLLKRYHQEEAGPPVPPGRPHLTLVP